jgi:rhodanese-related sulfurtransferase
MAQDTAARPDFHMLNQYANPANPEAHYKTTGPEIWRQTEGRITHFVASLGTCGTITGTGTFLKEQNPDVQVIGVHPEEGHDIPGVRSIRQLQQTKLFRPELYDQLVEVSNQEAFDTCLRINREESIIAGPSSAMALAGALKVVEDQPDAVVAIIFPDNVFKYASSLQRHFPDMFSTTAGSASNPKSKNDKEELLNKMIELSRNEENTVELEEAYQLREQEKVLYVDVRSSDQYSAAHIEGAANVPIAALLETQEGLPADKEVPIVAVCNRGKLSLQALLILKALGYQNVKSLNGGTIGWIEKGYPARQAK